MKKLLSILLAGILALSCSAVGAVAAPAEIPAEKYQTYDASLAAQGLVYTLPDVTALSAVWDGVILFDPFTFQPVLTPEHLVITATFAEGEPETLSVWQDAGSNWFWQLILEYDEDANKVLVYYIDSNLLAAYYDSLRGETDYDYDDLLDTLPSTVVALPANLFETFIAASKPFAALPAEPTELTLERLEYAIFSVTPAKDTMYFVTTQTSEGLGDPVVTLTDADFNILQTEDDVFGWDVIGFFELKAGETYYFFVTDYQGGTFDFAAVELEEISPVMRWIYRYLLGGWLWLPLVTVDGRYIFPGETPLGLLFDLISSFWSVLVG